MLTDIKNCWNDRLWRLSFLGIVILGFAVASIAPYRSIIGIERLGLNELEFALVSTLSAIFTVIASMGVGIYSDQTGRYRDVLLGSLFIGIIGNAILFAFPTKWVFMITLVLFFPVATTGFTQFFALAKLAANKNKKLNVDFSSSSIRAAFAGAYAVTPPIWAILVINGVDLLAIYGVSAVINFIMLILVYLKWPKEHAARKEQQERVSFFAAMRELTNAPLASRLVLIAIVGSVTKLNNTVMGLIILNDLGGTEADVGWFAGGAALIEVPVMLFSVAALKYITKSAFILIGVITYSFYLSAYAFLPSVDYLWWLILPAGIGGGIFIALVIGYVQDLLSDKPGTGGALISFTNIGGHIVTSIVFGACTTFTGYAETAMIGASLAVIAGVILVMIDGGEIRQTTDTKI